MTADDLYEEMKSALRFFGLSFHDKHLVEIRIQDSQLTFIHGNRTIVVSQLNQ